MADPVVHLTAGVPDSGTGNVTTLGQTLLDGANVTVGAKADAKSTATDTTAISVVSVLKQISASVQAPPSTAVTNTGTFAVQAAAVLGAETTKVIGTVNVAAAQTVAVTNAGTFAVTQATAANLNATVVGTGTFAVQSAATLNAETTKVIGTTRSADGAGVLLTSTSGALDVNIKSGMNTDGRQADNNSAPVALSTENVAILGIVTETAPVSDTASSGLNGRTQRVAQNITTLTGKLPTALGSAGGLKIDDIYSQYETVAASASAQAMGATGATGDYLAGVLVFPGTAACGVVTILDNATTIGSFPGGGTTALPSLIPFMIPIGLYSVSGAWKITTGASVTAVGIGKFT